MTLKDELTQIAARIAQYKGTGIGEQNTKAALIAPVLRSLEWDLENLEEVRLRSLSSRMRRSLFEFSERPPVWLAC